MRLRDVVRTYFDVVQEAGDEWVIRCPHPDHQDSKPSASVNVVKGLWCCYSCGAAGSVRRTLEGVNIFYAEPSLEDQLTELDELLLDPTPTYYLEAWLDQFDAGGKYIHSYWQERGFSKETVKEFRLGYDLESDCVTYPMRDPTGRVLGVVRRRLDSGQPKYKYPHGVKKTGLLFNYHNVGGGKTLVLCEGAIDVIALHDAGVGAVGIYGSSLHDEQVGLLNRLPVTSVVCCFDNDKAGIKATDYVMGLSSLRPLVRKAQIPVEYNDIAEVPVHLRSGIIEKAEVFL